MIPRLLFLFCVAVQALAMRPLAENFELEKVVGSGVAAFTWDERGRLWTLAGNELRSGETRIRAGKGSGVLVHGGRAVVADGESLREFDLRAPNRGTRIDVGGKVLGIQWGPLGHVYYSFEGGIGRVDLETKRIEVMARGLAAKSVGFDELGNVIAADGGLLFRVALGLDYAKGLENYSKADLAVGKGSAAVVDGGVWTVFSSAYRKIHQLKEDEAGVLKEWRDLADLEEFADVRQIQVGPDGASWILAEGGALLRLGVRGSSICPMDLSGLGTRELVAQLQHANPWQRDAALRLLDGREDLRSARGLHPGTPVHDLLQNQEAHGVARAYALRALHRVKLADDTATEDAALLGPWQLRAAAVELIGERGYTTGTAFKGMEKNAGHTNRFVRRAVQIAARRFVSSSFVEDTAPAFPIREVFTGGVLSGLWFSTERGTTPEFNLLYWNAVRPITAFDAAHAIGFFQGEEADGLEIAYWLVPRIARQAAEMEDPLRQEDAIVMMTNIKPGNHRLLAMMLEEMRRGKLRTTPTAKSIAALEGFAKSSSAEVAKAAAALLGEWREKRI